MMCEGLIDGEVRVMRRDRFQVTIEKVVWAKRNQTLHQLAEQEKINGGPSQ